MITAYMKATNKCNVGCSHCYLPESVRANSFKMGMDDVRASAEFLLDMQKFTRNEKSFVIWHGGEPLVISPDWYYKAGEILDDILPGHLETMQTSLIPFREEFVTLIKDRFNSFIGTSLDFHQRKLNGSIEAYHQLFMKKVEMARNNGIMVVPGVVPSRMDVGSEKEIVDWFSDREFRAFNIDRYNAYEAFFDDRPNNNEHSQFLIGIFDALMSRMEKYGEAPAVGAIKGGISGVLFGIGGDRWGGSCMSDFVVVEPDGGLNNCPDKSSIEPSFSNVRGGYKDFAMSKARRNWIRHQTISHRNSYCDGCENLSFCKTGCPITPNDPGVEGGECSGYKKFLSHVRNFAQRDGGVEVMSTYFHKKLGGGNKISVYENAVAASEKSINSSCSVNH